jgi:diguanylate cyclase (GGDEF)-like protein
MPFPSLDVMGFSGRRGLPDIDRDEFDRLRAVRRYGIPDLPSEETFDRICALTARLLQTPIAFIGIVDLERVWFLGRHGFALTEAPREKVYCDSLFLHATPWVIADARLDSRTSNHPLVIGEFGLRFYAGTPLITNDGYNLGALCAIDRRPRQPSPLPSEVLDDLAALVMHQMELRLEIHCAMKMDDTLLQRSRSERRRAEYEAKHDLLTGLGNRRKLYETLAVEINRLHRHGGSLCLSIADIDHFKKINDIHGHAAGDEILSQLGELLSMQVRPTDTAARIGGEEFVVLMPHTDIKEAFGAAERLRTALSGKKFGSLDRPVTLSIGVAELQNGDNAAALLQRADQALYCAKRAGRNQVVAAEAAIGNVEPAITE